VRKDKNGSQSRGYSVCRSRRPRLQSPASDTDALQLEQADSLQL